MFSPLHLVSSREGQEGSAKFFPFSLSSECYFLRRNSPIYDECQIQSVKVLNLLRERALLRPFK